VSIAAVIAGCKQLLAVLPQITNAVAIALVADHLTWNEQFKLNILL
jgi:hypothetical protein